MITVQDSLVTVSVVSLASETKPVFFDFVARDPDSRVIFSKPKIDDAELAFKNRVVGRHTFCLTVSTVSRGPLKLGKPARSVQLDILVGETWSHNRVTKDHLDTLHESVSQLTQRVQRLHSETRHLRFREERHRTTVESTERRVLRYAIAKWVVIVTIAVAQPLILMYFLKNAL